MDKIEVLLRNSADTHNGWTKNKNKRVIRIGHTLNCNNDSLIRDDSIEEKMINLMNKYDIDSKSFDIEKIRSELEHSFELSISEEEYSKLTEKFKKN